MADVVVVANDIVPGFGLPVAAPGLRAHGLAIGLRCHGIDTIVTVPRALVEREWSKRSNCKSWPAAPRTAVLPDSELKSFIEVQRPKVVILTNSNKFDAVGRHREARYVYDFFAPKMMELAETPMADQGQNLAALRDKKLRALEQADAIIVNGRKKTPYVLEWLGRTRRGVDGRAVEVVNMPVEPCFRAPIDDGSVHLALAGYLVPWLRFGQSLGALRRVLDECPELTLHLWMPEHWGGVKREHPELKSLSHLRSHPRTKVRGPQLFEDFQHHLSQMDLFADLFLQSPERELATVTRTVTATACGLPVVHPTFTECSPLIADYDSGWLVDASDQAQLVERLKAIISDRRDLTRKRANARRLAEEVFSPKAATAPLARIIRSWQ